MRIALLSYRSKEHCGGQGVYVRHLSHGLTELGHQVEVFSGQPYPQNLDPRVQLTLVPSLDLFGEPDPGRLPKLSELRDRYDVLEYLTALTGCFAEPLAFSMRAQKLMRQRAEHFDVVHDNQTLATACFPWYVDAFPWWRRFTIRSAGTANWNWTAPPPGNDACPFPAGTGSSACRPGSPDGFRW